MVSYYESGWRTGRLEEIKGRLAWIKPTPAIGGAARHAVTVPIEDIRTIGG